MAKVAIMKHVAILNETVVGIEKQWQFVRVPVQQGKRCRDTGCGKEWKHIPANGEYESPAVTKLPGNRTPANNAG